MRYKLPIASYKVIIAIARNCEFISNNSEKKSHNCEYISKNIFYFYSVAEKGFHIYLLINSVLNVFRINTFFFLMTAFDIVDHACL